MTRACRRCCAVEGASQRPRRSRDKPSSVRLAAFKPTGHDCTAQSARPSRLRHCRPCVEAARSGTALDTCSASVQARTWRGGRSSRWWRRTSGRWPWSARPTTTPRSRCTSASASSRRSASAGTHTAATLYPRLWRCLRCLCPAGPLRSPADGPGGPPDVSRAHLEDTPVAQVHTVGGVMPISSGLRLRYLHDLSHLHTA